MTAEMTAGINPHALPLLAWGHALMALCALLYLSWWAIFFRPAIPKVTGILYICGVGCIIGAAIAGIAGAVVIGMGSAKAAAVGSPSGWWFVLGALVVYGILVFVTTRFCHRVVTTELALFVAWSALELACVCILGSSGGLPQTRAIILGCVIVVLFAIMLVCYLLYYTLPPAPSFIDGAIPLALVGIYSLGCALLFGNV